MDYAVIPLLNGFDPADENRIDEFSRLALMKAAALYRKLKNGGASVGFVVIKSVVKSSSGKNVWFEVMKKWVIAAGVDENDIIVTEMETINALTDGLALSRFSQKNPETKMFIISYAHSIVLYFRLTYKSVARIIDGYDFNFQVIPSDGQLRPNIKSKLLYWGLGIFTALITTGYTDFLFRLWFKFRNYHDKKRIDGFVRTVE